ncbi:unknown [Bifidobacterium bifidum CAG:234]|nr:unknown [Bifidobacterium bifidum CAG:234]
MICAEFGSILMRSFRTLKKNRMIFPFRMIFCVNVSK